jgi:hypothetical protein
MNAGDYPFAVLVLEGRRIQEWRLHDSSSSTPYVIENRNYAGS